MKFSLFSWVFTPLRIAFDLSETAKAEFEDLKRRSNADSNADLVRNALRLYAWYLNEMEDGSKIILRKDGVEKEVELEF